MWSAERGAAGGAGCLASRATAAGCAPAASSPVPIGHPCAMTCVDQCPQNTNMKAHSGMHTCAGMQASWQCQNSLDIALVRPGPRCARLVRGQRPHVRVEGLQRLTERLALRLVPHPAAGAAHSGGEGAVPAILWLPDWVVEEQRPAGPDCPPIWLLTQRVLPPSTHFPFLLPIPILLLYPSPHQLPPTTTIAFAPTHSRPPLRCRSPAHQHRPRT